MKLRNVIFYVKDIEKAKAFYKKIGFKLNQDFGKFVSFETGVNNLYFSLNSSLDKERIPGKQVCVFWIEDINEFYKKMKRLKVAIHEKLCEASFGKTFSIQDVDGNKVEFVERN